MIESKQPLLVWLQTRNRSRLKKPDSKQPRLLRRPSKSKRRPSLIRLCLKSNDWSFSWKLKEPARKASRITREHSRSCTASPGSNCKFRPEDDSLETFKSNGPIKFNQAVFGFSA